jgi:hypothetical protein
LVVSFKSTESNLWAKGKKLIGNCLLDRCFASVASGTQEALAESREIPIGIGTHQESSNLGVLVTRIGQVGDDDAIATSTPTSTSTCGRGDGGSIA